MSAQNIRDEILKCSGVDILDSSGNYRKLFDVLEDLSTSFLKMNNCNISKEEYFTQIANAIMKG